MYVFSTCLEALFLIFAYPANDPLPIALVILLLLCANLIAILFVALLLSLEDTGFTIRSVTIMAFCKPIE